MAELKAAEHRPVRGISRCPRCRPWYRHARTRPTAASDLPDQPARALLFTGVVADIGRRGGRRRGRGGLSPPPLRVDPCAAMLRASRPGSGRRSNLASCPGAQRGWLAPPKQSPGQLCSRRAASGKRRGALKRRFASLTKNPNNLEGHITIVVFVATVGERVKING